MSLVPLNPHKVFTSSSHLIAVHSHLILIFVKFLEGMRYLMILCLLASSSRAALIVDYNAPGSVSDLGSPQLESSPGHFEGSTNAGAHAYIKPDSDPDEKPALHYYRDSWYRRAEVLAKGHYGPNENYFVGYKFRLSDIHEHLALFQW